MGRQEHSSLSGEAGAGIIARVNAALAEWDALAESLDDVGSPYGGVVLGAAAQAARSALIVTIKAANKAGPLNSSPFPDADPALGAALQLLRAPGGHDPTEYAAAVVAAQRPLASAELELGQDERRGRPRRNVLARIPAVAACCFQHENGRQFTSGWHRGEPVSVTAQIAMELVSACSIRVLSTEVEHYLTKYLAELSSSGRTPAMRDCAPNASIVGDVAD